ncbi:hypothetical protein Tco_1570783 [Tanacetum coccineum]
MVRSFCEMVIQRKQAAYISTHTLEPSRHLNFTCDDEDDDEEYSIPLKDMPQISPSISLAPVSSIMKPKDSLIIGNEELNTIPKKESDEFIKSSVKDLIPIPRESEDTSGSDKPEDSLIMGNEELSTIPKKESDKFIKSSVKDLIPILRESKDSSGSDSESVLPSSDDFSPIVEEKSDIKCKDSYDSNLDESTFLVTPLSNSNEDGFFTPRDDIELLLHHDPSISVASILEGFIDDPPLEENDDLFDLESQENDWKKILYDAPIDDLITEDKVFDPKIHEKSFSPTFVKLTFEDRHYFSITFVIQIFLPYLTYSVNSPFLLSSVSEDTIFDPGIFTFHFSSLKPVAYENPMVIFPFFCFCPKDKRIRFGRHHSGGFRRLTTPRHHLGLRHRSPTPQGAAGVAVPSSDRHHDGGVSPRLSHDGCDGDGIGGCRGCWRWSDGGSSVACDDEVEEMKMKVVVMIMIRGCWWCDGVDRDDRDGVDMVPSEQRWRGRGGSGDRRL